MTAPWWASEDGRVTLYHGDCATILPSLEPVVQLIVTSPPYNVQRDYGEGQGDRLPLEEYQLLLSSWIEAMAQILRPGGVLALNLPGGIALDNGNPGRFDARGFRARNGQERRRMESITEHAWTTFPIGGWAEEAVIRAGLLPRRTVIWVKGPEGEAYATSLACGSPANPFLRPAHERVILASKERYRRDGAPAAARPIADMDVLKDVWHISASSGYGSRDTIAHPCPFPPELPRRCMVLFSEPDDLVIDPFVGSGTTGEVARQLGRRFIGIDTNAEYLAYAKERIIRGTRAASKITQGQAVLL